VGSAGQIRVRSQGFILPGLFLRSIPKGLKSTSPGLSRGAGSYPGSTPTPPPIYPERVVSGSRFLHFQPMPQSLAKILVHTVFSTKDRRPFLREKALREELHRYLGMEFDGVRSQLLTFAF